MKTVTLQCATCGEDFEKNSGQHKSRLKKGATDFYCTRSCFASRPANLARMESMRLASAKVLNIADYAANKNDKFYGLREHLRRAKKRGEKYQGLTLEDLLEVWTSQQGRCACTGVELQHPHSHGHDISKNFLASLDRIDSSIGYKKGNVQFISATANNMKNDMSEEEVQQFFDIIRGIQRSDSITA